MTRNWKCGDCKNSNPADAPICICGKERPAASTQNKSAHSRRFPIWIAALPGVLAAGFLMMSAAFQFSHVAGQINPGSLDRSGKSTGSHCVETYGVTLSSSDQYVREWTLGAPANNATRTPEISTVLRGMARNGCGEDLKNVRIRLVVRDEAGAKGEGSYMIDGLVVGEAKPFERAWMGRVTSYEITAGR